MNDGNQCMKQKLSLLPIESYTSLHFLGLLVFYVERGMEELNFSLTPYIYPFIIISVFTYTHMEYRASF